jgi:hypothetical protein
VTGKAEVPLTETQTITIRKPTADALKAGLVAEEKSQQEILPTLQMAERSSTCSMPRRSEGFAAEAKKHACPASAKLSRQPGRSFDAVYLRAAQAYMLISMPTGTSTIFGVFQVIRVSQVVFK